MNETDTILSSAQAPDLMPDEQEVLDAITRAGNQMQETMNNLMDENESLYRLLGYFVAQAGGRIELKEADVNTAIEGKAIQHDSPDEDTLVLWLEESTTVTTEDVEPSEPVATT